MKLRTNGALLDSSFEPNNDNQDRSSAWLSENDIYDKKFEEKIRLSEKQLINQPILADRLLQKHNLIFGIVPNQRQLDKIVHQNLKSKIHLTKIENKTQQKLSTFLNSNKMTHKELTRIQELKRKR